MKWLSWLWLHFLAFFRLSERAICEASRGKVDYHDYPDTEHGWPMHFMTHRCKRCGKLFEI